MVDMESPVAVAVPEPVPAPHLAPATHLEEEDGSVRAQSPGGRAAIEGATIADDTPLGEAGWQRRMPPAIGSGANSPIGTPRHAPKFAALPALESVDGHASPWSHHGTPLLQLPDEESVWSDGDPDPWGVRHHPALPFTVRLKSSPLIRRIYDPYL